MEYSEVSGMKGRCEHPFPLFRRPCVKLPVWTQAARRYWTGSLVPVCVALRLAVVWTQSVLRLRERSQKSLSLSGDHHVSKRGGERERETGGEEGVTADADNAILRCVFTSHMFYPNP